MLVTWRPCPPWSEPRFARVFGSRRLHRTARRRWEGMLVSREARGAVRRWLWSAALLLVGPVMAGCTSVDIPRDDLADDTKSLDFSSGAR